MFFNVSFLNINFSLAASLAWTQSPQTSHPPYAVDPVLIGQRNFCVKSTASAVRPAERWWLLPKIGKDITSLLSAYVVSQIKVDSQIWFLAQLFVQFFKLYFFGSHWLYGLTNERTNEHMYAEGCQSATRSLPMSICECACRGIVHRTKRSDCTQERFERYEFVHVSLCCIFMYFPIWPRTISDFQ